MSVKPQPASRQPAPKNEAVPPASRALSVTVEGHIRAYFAAHEHGLPANGIYSRVLREIERPLLSVVMEACGGNQLRAAELLGLNRNTLRKKLRELGLVGGARRREKGAADGSAD